MRFIFYDTKDCRAWLVDGANALLHMTRAQLSQKPWRDSELFEIQSFPHANPELGQEAPLQSVEIIGK